MNSVETTLIFEHKKKKLIYRQLRGVELEEGGRGGWKPDSDHLEEPKRQ